MSAEEIVESLLSEVIMLKAVEAYAQAVHWTVEASDRELAEHDDTRKAARLRELDAEKGLLNRGYVFLPPNDQALARHEDGNHHDAR